ncbi:hypothetical protein GGG16DRAFT_111262 [Schizophyllum commune]
MDSITAGLRDPYHPENCSKYYNKNFSILWDADRAEEQSPEKKNRPGSNPFNRHVRRRKHTFLNTCWAFLTAPRSPEQIQALAKDMDTRHLDNNDGQDVDDAGDGFQLALLKIIGFVTLVLRLAPDDYWKSQRRVKRAETRGKRVSWPPHARTLLGPDPDTTIVALCRWMAAYPSWWHFALLGELSRICGRPAAMVMFRCTQIPSSFVHVLESELDKLPENPTSANTTLNMLRPILHTLHWWRLTSVHPDGMATAYFFAEECHRVLALINRCFILWGKLKKLPREICPTLDEWCFYSYDGGSIHSKLDLPYDESLYLPPILESSKRIRAVRAEDNIFVLAHTKLEDQCIDHCGFPPCMATFAGEGRRFAVCGGCQRIPYCSRECQARHWRWERSAHRDVCADILYLAKKLGYPSIFTPKPWALDFTRYNVQSHCEREGVDKAAIERIARYEKDHLIILKEVYGGSADATTYANRLS